MDFESLTEITLNRTKSDNFISISGYIYRSINDDEKKCNSMTSRINNYDIHAFPSPPPIFSPLFD